MKKIKKILMIYLMVALIVIMFRSNYNFRVKELESVANSKAILVNEHVRLSKAFLEHMTMYSKDFLHNGNIKNSELLVYVDYNSDGNYYSMEHVLDMGKSGNLTGAGNIPEDRETRDELNLALEYNKYFKNFYDILPDVTWLYYMSEKKFINMYPWVSSKDFKYSDELKDVQFYKIAVPQNNPNREVLWTPVYQDQAGKGLMVTLSSPVYYNDKFKGVLSLDLTTDYLSKIINSEYDTYLIDGEDSVIATNTYAEYIKNVIKLNVIMGVSQHKIDEIKRLKSDTIHEVGDYFIYSSAFNDAPWKMITIVPKYNIIGRSVLSVMPMILICILLLLSLNEVDNRKKIEEMLVNSLKDLRSYHDKLEDAAKYDFLTNTYNRRGLIEIFNKNVSSRKIRNGHISFIMSDIDHFKKINDTYGHAAGDKVLIELSTVMKNIINDGNVVCRWGGEEFLIMLIGMDQNKAAQVAEKIREEIENTVIVLGEAHEIKMTMTLGVAEYNHDDGFDSCIIKVDEALYEGKRNGRNQVVVYSDAN